VDPSFDSKKGEMCGSSQHRASLRVFVELLTAAIGVEIDRNGAIFIIEKSRNKGRARLSRNCDRIASKPSMTEPTNGTVALIYEY
jgi:hypothetical protein